MADKKVRKAAPAAQLLAAVALAVLVSGAAFAAPPKGCCACAGTTCQPPKCKPNVLVMGDCAKACAAQGSDCSAIAYQSGRSCESGCRAQKPKGNGGGK